MKKLNLLIVVSLLFAVASVEAQSEDGGFAKKGTKLLNPQLLSISFQSMSFNTSSDDSDEGQDLSQLGLSVSGGYAIADNLFLIGQVAGQSFKFGSDDAAKLSLISIGAGARYYLGKFFLGAGVLANNGKISAGGIASDYDDYDEIDLSGDDLSTTIIGYRAEAGYAIFLTPSVALEPSVSYGGKLAGGEIKVGGEKMDSKLKYSQFGVNLGVSIFF